MKRYIVVWIILVLFAATLFAVADGYDVRRQNANDLLLTRKAMIERYKLGRKYPPPPNVKLRRQVSKLISAVEDLEERVRRLEEVDGS